MAQKETYDVIVIGAGIEGSATAYNLVNMKKKVLLLEQFALPHTRGSSHGQSRIIRKAYTQTCYAEMMDEAYAMWSTLEKETDTKLYQKTGLLVVSQPPSQAVNNTEHALKRQGASYRRLNGSELRQEFSMMRFGSDCEALYEDDGGILRADKCLQALQRMFVARGGVLRDAEPVTNVTPGPRVTVTSSLRSYDAGSVVITAGAWTSRLTKPLGLNLPLKVEGINVCYWRAVAPMKLPCFIIEDVPLEDMYGLPALEYPGFVKVDRIGVFYWKEKTPLKSPCFIVTNVTMKGVYGLPAFDYPGFVKVDRIGVFYWKEKTPLKSPCFIVLDVTMKDVYGLPALEYPSVVKVVAVGVYYWRQEAGDGPCFIAAHPTMTHVYAIPVWEYPHLYKVEGIRVCYFTEKTPSPIRSAETNQQVCFTIHKKDFRSYAYGLPSLDYPGMTKVCSHYGDEVDPDKRDLVQSTRDLEDLQNFVSKHLPGLESQPSIIERCMYTTTPDADFILDRHPHHDNIVIGAGFSGHGFKMAPVIGRILGEMATGAPPSYNLQPFRISRFYTLPVQSKM